MFFVEGSAEPSGVDAPFDRCNSDTATRRTIPRFALAPPGPVRLPSPWQATSMPHGPQGHSPTDTARPRVAVAVTGDYARVLPASSLG